MIDASLSAPQGISFEQQARRALFIAQVLRPEDRLAVYSFDESVHEIRSVLEERGLTAERGAAGRRGRAHPYTIF